MYTTRFILILIYIISIKLFTLFLYILHFSESFCLFNCFNWDNSAEEFDYIIVGCGSAGAIVANRLSENMNNKILVLEAGHNSNSLLDVPSIGILLQNSPFDWKYETVPQSQACKGLDRNVSVWPSGKIVGGTSMLNNMIYVRGHETDFDNWFKDKPYYKNFSNDILPYLEKIEYFGIDRDKVAGSTVISNPSYVTELPHYISNAMGYLGYSNSKNILNCNDGIGEPKVNLNGGQRWTTAHTLRLNNRENVVLKTGRVVEKLIFKSNFEAHALKYNYLERSFIARASKGIILSAGVIGTAKILMLSGVGNKTELNNIDIKPRIDLPVGENLQDHVTTGLDLVLLNRTLDIGLHQMFLPSAVFNYFLNGTGPWTTCGCEFLMFTNTSSKSSLSDLANNKDLQPDLQLMVMPLAINEDSGVYLRKLLGISDYTFNNYFAQSNDIPAITILPILLHPKSRGTVKLLDNNVFSKPMINPQYLSHVEDVEVLIRGIELIKKIVKTEAMQKLGARINPTVFPGCETFNFDTKPYWECYIRHLSITSYHPAGTCRMGPHNATTTVVNYDFQVKHTNNLYVVDASVMPTLTSGNINGAIMMLAEMASDIIKRRDYFSSGNCFLVCWLFFEYKFSCI